MTQAMLPAFEFGVWAQPAALAATWKARGVSVMNADAFGQNVPSAADADAFISACHAQGMKVYLTPDHITGSQKPDMVLMWDEPEGWENLGDRAQATVNAYVARYVAAMQAAKAKGYKLLVNITADIQYAPPTWQSTDKPFGLDSYLAILSLADVTSMDFYSRNRGRLPTTFYDDVAPAITRMVALSGFKPFTFFIETSVQEPVSNPSYIGPNATDVLMQATFAIMLGASGIHWFPQQFEDTPPGVAVDPINRGPLPKASSDGTPSAVVYAISGFASTVAANQATFTAPPSAVAKPAPGIYVATKNGVTFAVNTTTAAYSYGRVTLPPQQSSIWGLPSTPSPAPTPTSIPAPAPAPTPASAYATQADLAALAARVQALETWRKS